MEEPAWNLVVANLPIAATRFVSIPRQGDGPGKRVC